MEMPEIPSGFHCSFGPVTPCCPPLFLSLVMKVFSLCCDILEVCTSFSHITGAHSSEIEPSLRSRFGRRVLTCVRCVASSVAQTLKLPALELLGACTLSPTSQVPDALELLGACALSPTSRVPEFTGSGVEPENLLF